MPLDPYFTRDGEKKFTCRGEKRAVFTEQEKLEADDLLKRSKGEQAKINLDITERLRANKPVSRAEKRFHNLMRRQQYDRRSLVPQLTHAHAHS